MIVFRYISLDDLLVDYVLSNINFRENDKIFNSLKNFRSNI